MHDLIPLDLALPGALTTAEIDFGHALGRGREVSSDSRGICQRLEGLLHLVLQPWRHAAASYHVGIVAAYLSALADSGRKASTVGRRAAAIGYHHKMAGHEPPTSSEAVKAVLRGIRRTIGSAKQGKAPATADLIGQMVALCPDNMIGKRFRAAVPGLLLGRSAAVSSARWRSPISPRSPTGVADPDPAQQGRSGRAGAGGGDPARLQAPPGRGGAGVAGSGGDQQRARVPSSDAGRTGVVRGHGGRQRGADREAVCPAGRPGSCVLCRPSLRSGFLTKVERRAGPRSGSSARCPVISLWTLCAAMSGASICSRSTLEQRSSDGNMHAIDIDYAQW